MSGIFTAAQFSRALGYSPQRMRQVLAPDCSGRDLVRGQETACWPISALPHDMKARLSHLAKASELSAAEFVEAAQERFRCPAEMKFQPDAPAKASALRELVGPVLRASSGCSLSNTADSVRQALTGTDIFPLRSARTVRRLVERLQARVGEARDFQNLDIYLAEFFLREQPPRKAAGACRHLALWASAGTPDIEGAAFESGHFWDAAVADLEEIAEAAGMRRAKAAVMDWIEAAGLGVAASRDSLRKKLEHRLCLKRAGTVPSRIVGSAMRRGRCGRKRKYELNEAEQRRLVYWRIKRNGSLPRALKDLAEDRACRPEIAGLIQGEFERARAERCVPRWPASLYRQARVSPEARALSNGPRDGARFGLKSRRSPIIIEEDGSKVAMRPHDIWESDDVSINEPYCFRSPMDGTWLVCRQALATIDVASGAWLSVEPIGRERDAYRAEDIADHFYQSVIQHGLPRVWRIEQGRWNNNWVWGVEIAKGVRWGGICDLIKIDSVHSSNGKGLIESSFNPLQRELATMSTSIGRRRGEKEAASRLVSRARRGDIGALKAFWSIQAAADGMHKAMTDLNAIPKLREALGPFTTIPEDILAGATKRACPAAERWRFLPIKRLLRVRGGAVEVNLSSQGYTRPARFSVRGESRRYLHEGEPVLVAFHPGHPEWGCHVFDGDPNSPSFQELMLVAEAVFDAPQYSFAADRPTHEQKRRASAARRSEFRGITASGIKRLAVSEARDSSGASAISGENLDHHVLGTQFASSERRAKGEAAIRMARGKIHDDYDEDAELARAEAGEAELRARGLLIS